MLEKIEKKLYFDAHFHYSDCIEQNAFDFFDGYNGCTCAHSIEEWKLQDKLNEENGNCQLAFGLHPQSAEFIDYKKNIDLLEILLRENKISAVGEAGFDYYTEAFKNQKEKQEIMWQSQLELAIKYNKPMIIHCRKANEKLFEYAQELKKLPSVLFHSFMGTPIEANSLLNKGINGYFSFGKQLMNNNKKVISCFSQLPINVLLCETDAPFQYLKNQTKTYVSDIEEIYVAAFSLRPDIENFEKFKLQMEINYKNFLKIN